MLKSSKVRPTRSRITSRSAPGISLAAARRDSSETSPPLIQSEIMRLWSAGGMPVVMFVYSCSCSVLKSSGWSGCSVTCGCAGGVAC